MPWPESRPGCLRNSWGEKLGVSQQAVSKWESGQNNPDVAYLAEMCRLFGVSSDWLLLGKETEQASAPARCPDCQAIVTGLDNFCPNCGCSLRSPPKEQYALVLRSIIADPVDSNVLYRICKEGTYCPTFPLPEDFSSDDTHRILNNAPRVLFRGLTLDQALAIQGRFLQSSYLQICSDPTGNTPLPRLMDCPYKPDTEHGMSFSATVAAVILGVMCAILILSFL